MSNSNPNGYLDQPGSQNLLSQQSQNSAAYQSGYSNGQANLSNQGTAAPTTWINNQGVAPVNPNSYQYGGAPGGAASQNSYYQGLAQQQAGQQGAQIQNQYDPRDQAQVQGVLGSLGSYYQGQLNGTGPSLAAQQSKASMDQSIAAQMAAANSARGGLAGASAQIGAAQQGAAAQQAAAQQAVQGRIQEEQAAAQGMQGLGQLSEGEQNINAQTAYQQAALQQQQQDINARSALGYAGLENQVNTEQLNAQMAQQAQMAQAYEAASGQGMQQGMFNTQQSNNMLMGGLGAASGLLLAFADADLQEPGGPAHWTLREEPNFILAKNQRTGELRKLATQPLSPEDMRQALAHHGAGPLGANDPRRMRTTASDMNLARTKQTYADADMNSFANPAIQGQLADLDWGASNAGGAMGGGTALSQLRAQEQAKYQAAQPLGGYTFGQQQFYGMAPQPAQGLTSDQAAQAFGGNGPSLGAMAGQRVGATGGYDQGWDNVAKPAASPAAQQGASKINQAGADLLKSSIARIGQPVQLPPVGVPYGYGGQAGGFTPMNVPSVSGADVDLGPRPTHAQMTAGMTTLHRHMAQLEAVRRGRR